MTEDWKDRVLTSARKQDENRPAKGRVSTNLHDEERVLIQRAAEKRGLSVGAYLGRSIMAMVCHDLGLDWDTVMKDEGPVARYGVRAIYDHTPARGQGFGKWRITDVR